MTFWPTDARPALELKVDPRSIIACRDPLEAHCGCETVRALLRYG